MRETRRWSKTDSKRWSLTRIWAAPRHRYSAYLDRVRQAAPQGLGICAHCRILDPCRVDRLQHGVSVLDLGRRDPARDGLPAGGRGPPTNDQAKKSGAITPRDTLWCSASRAKGSTVLALSRTLRAGSAGAAAFAAASLTAAARGALPVGRSGRRDGRFRSNKGMLLYRPE